MQAFGNLCTSDRLPKPGHAFEGQPAPIAPAADATDGQVRIRRLQNRVVSNDLYGICENLNAQSR